MIWLNFSVQIIRLALIFEVKKYYILYVISLIPCFILLLTHISEMKIGPIPIDDGVGKEIITRMTANMATDRTFYTDSNGRDFLKRVRFIFKILLFYHKGFENRCSLGHLLFQNHISV